MFAVAILAIGVFGLETVSGYVFVTPHHRSIDVLSAPDLAVSGQSAELSSSEGIRMTV